ncbi:V-type proton ATPase subunit E [Trichomonascus vanleenenianus]|uniref:V-type proton ATPase subunit E n=1 Tax=Trichomonascus vanleenenianus TaxID=2268995 RepID=UPI003ECAFA13
MNAHNEHLETELEQMVAYILREAREKAAELELKAEEEYFAARTRLVAELKEAVDEQYDSRHTQARLSSQVSISGVRNKTRLSLLRAKQEELDTILAEARANLKHVAKKKTKYARLLKGLVLEGLLTLMELEVTLQIRKGDIAMVLKILPEVIGDYAAALGRAPEDITIAIDRHVFVANSAGGVVVTGHGGRIVIDNTLERRLDLVAESALPAIRQRIFGTSPP